MLLYPRSDANSDDDRLDLLADPELAKRLRKANPKFFTRAGHGSIAKILALAGIVSLIAGYVIEPAVLAQHRANPPLLTTTVHHVAPAPPHVLKRYAAAPVIHVKPSIVVAHKAIAVETERVPQLQPKKLPVHRTRAIAVAQPQPQAQNEERFWLKAQAEARARDRARAARAAAAATAAASAPVQAPVDTQVTAPQPPAPQPPVSGPRVPGPFGGSWPTLPGGGPCTPGRGPILVGGHGLAGVLINAVLQSAIPVHHMRPFGRP